MKRVLAVATVVLLILQAGCFGPRQKKQRRLALIVESGLLVAGVATLGVAPTGADCRRLDDGCEGRSTLINGTGLLLLVAGVGGLVATISASDPESARYETLPTPLPSASPAPAPKPAEPPIEPASPGEPVPPASDSAAMPSPGPGR